MAFVGKNPFGDKAMKGKYGATQNMGYLIFGGNKEAATAFAQKQKADDDRLAAAQAELARLTAQRKATEAELAKQQAAYTRKTNANQLAAAQSAVSNKAGNATIVAGGSSNAADTTQGADVDTPKKRKRGAGLSSALGLNL